jgi:O-antigen/teichoic acid export membrane protein
VFLIILRYVPANVVPAVMAFAAVSVFTRHLSPAEYGDYTFAFSAALLVTTTLFYALPTVVVQMVPGAEIAGRREVLLTTAYRLLATAIVVLAALAGGAALIPAVRHALPAAVWLAAPLAALRGVIAINQSMNQVDGHVRSYSVIECAQSVLGFGAAVALILLRGPSAVNLMLGFSLAALACVLLDTRASRAVLSSLAVAWPTAQEIVHLALPLTVIFLAGALLIYADRFALETLSTASALGLYGVAAALVERPLTTLCTTVQSALYPLAVQVLGRQGDVAGRAQVGRNVLAVISVTLPASVGIALLAHPIADLLVGVQFRAGAAALIPWFAVAVFCRSLATHCFDHAFYLGRRPHLMLKLYAPVTLLNVVFVCLGAWFYGVYGTIATAILCAMLLVGLEWRAIQGFFPLPISSRDLAKIAAAAAVMGVVVLLCRPQTGDWFGLLGAIMAGAGTYAVLYVGANVLGVRDELGRRLRAVGAKARRDVKAAPHGRP